MKTLDLKKLIKSLPGKCNLILTTCITLFFCSVNALIMTASAQSVLFDFDNAPLYSSLPITLTQGGITAHFSAGYYGYSIQNANVLGFTPQGFAGRCIYPNSIYLTDLYVGFDQTLTHFSILYACDELGCDDAATMRVTAYMNGSYVGTNTKTASHPGTWPSDSLTCTFAQGFDSVVVHYDSPPPTCQDYGVIYMADNMKVTAGGCSPPTTQQAAISAGGPTTFCSGGSVALTVATAGLTYQWKNGTSIISGATLQKYTASASGSYSCNVSNSCGTTGSNSIIVTVNAAPTSAQAAISAQGPTTFCKGNNVVLSVAAAGFTYQWKNGNKNVSGATLQNYTVNKSGTYTCIVSNNCGSVTSNSITVIVNPLPTVTISQDPCSNHAVLLHANANPGTGITYQWMKGSKIISGATNSTYSATQGATYKCNVTITATSCNKTSAGSKVTISCRLGDVANESQVIVYPNPTSNYFNINTAQLDPQSMIYIYDMMGRLCENHIVNGGEMQIGALLPNGIYILKIVTGNETKQVIKLVKNF